MIARAAARIDRGHIAIACLAVACSLLVQGVSDNQSSHYALVRALSDGTPRIDRYRHETSDSVRFKGHYYSSKSPGLAQATLLPYRALAAAKVPEASRRAARRHHDTKPYADMKGIIWALGLFGALLPGAVLLFLVRNVADKIEPGYGTAAAVTLGVCTLVLPFLTMYFAHILSATLGFAAFAVLLHERRREPRPTLVLVAGLLAGLGVTTEYPLAIVAAVLFLYSLGREDRGRRALMFGAGLAAGLVPLLAFNWWAFGSPLHVSYTGVKLQSAGLFGVRLPSLRVALELLLAKKGLLVMSPVIAMAAVGVGLIYRAGRRAEALTIAGIALAILVYTAGYRLDRSTAAAPPFIYGFNTPGPRLLLPALPFLGIGLASAWRRFPVATLASAVVSAGWFLAATTTEPLANGDIGVWAPRVFRGDFTASVLTELGAGHGWLSIAPFLLGIAAAVALAVQVTARPAGGPRDLPLAVAFVGGSVAAAFLGHRLLDRQWGLGVEYGRLALALLAAGLGALVLSSVRSTRRPRAH